MAKTGLNIKIKIFNNILSKNKKIIKIYILTKKLFYIKKWWSTGYMPCIIKIKYFNKQQNN